MRISVVIVVRNRAGYLAESLQSILDQSYPAHEIVLVDVLGDEEYIKGSISQIDHPRIKCVFRDEDKAYSSAIGEGCHASTGEIICFLDGSDKFKREKLGEVAKYFGDHPHENIISHSCFVVSRDGKILSLWRPKAKISLEDLLLQEPMPLSAIAIRRSSVHELISNPESAVVDAGWMSFVVHLLLPNIPLNVIDRPLSDCRAVSNPGEITQSDYLQHSIRILEMIFDHPDCPESLLRLRESALARIHLKLAYEAFVRGDTAIGREMLRSSIYLDRSILDVQAYRFFFFLIVESVKEEDHQNRIARVFGQLPAEMIWMLPHMNEVIARGFVLHGIRAILWGRVEEGKLDLAEALRLGCRIDQYFYYALAEELLGCETVYGPGDVDLALHSLTPYLEKMSTPSLVRWFKGEFFANRSFREFNKGRYSLALRSIQYAILTRPEFMANRGLLVTLFRSLGRLRSRRA